MTNSDKAESRAEPPALGSALSEGIGTIEIGVNHRKYCVHKALLADHSEYFKKTLQSPWKDAQECVATLEDVEPAVFHIFVHWLYTQQILGVLDCDIWDRIMELPNCSSFDGINVKAWSYAFSIASLRHGSDEG